MHLTLLSLVAGIGLGFAACNQNGEETAPPRWASAGHRCSAGAPAISLSTAARDSLPADPDSLSQPGRSARLAREVPGGWGGFFLENGVPTILLTDKSRLSDVVAAVNQRGFEGRTLGADVRVRQGRWDFAQLYDWWRYLNPRVGAEAVVGTGIDLMENRILYRVASEAGVRALEARLEVLRVPCFLVAVEVGPAPYPASPAR